ncbi:MAG: FAD-binding protein [Trueperaceae bacterium]|nr:MAG: FAD-binding protein [Trueperaceae bacterium]
MGRLKLVDELKTILAPERVVTNRTVLEQHARGESFDEAALPDVVVYPESTQEVAEILKYATENRVAVTPVAVNSSLEGHTVPLLGGISLDLTRLDRILEFRPEDLLVVAQPGVTYPQLNKYVRRSGLFFPVDPGAHASLGGMIATNASGTAAVRYGVTGDYVLALEVVLPTGEVIRTGSRARKSSSGYDLTRLYCGSEGTLGVITEVTLRLSGLPEAASAARVPFSDAESATTFVTNLIQAGVPVARCELVDANSIRVVNAHQGTRFPEEMTIFLEFHGNPPGVAADLRLAEKLARDSGALLFESSSDVKERERLWEARHNMFYAAVAANPGKRNITSDVAVPISKLPVAVSKALCAHRDSGLNGYLVGHVGDGNFHIVTFFDGDDELAKVEQLNHQMVTFALSIGGTSTGEHGVGVRKLKYMELEHGGSLELMKRIKRSFDPHTVMNPGKKIPGVN